MLRWPTPRQTLAGIIALLAGVLLVAGLFVALATTGHPGPLTRAIAIAETVLDWVDDVRNPLAPDPDAGLAEADQLLLTHGVASGDVTDSSAVIWARANGPATMHVAAEPLGSDAPAPVEATVDVTARDDYAGQVALADLQPDTAYTYRVWLTRALDVGTEIIASDSVTGRFRTAPAPGQPAPVTLLFGGDLGGAGNCRLAAGGYPIFDAMARLDPSLVLLLGDMIYADNTCPRDGPNGRTYIPGAFRPVDHGSIDWRKPAQTLPVYWAHWRYNRADPALQRLLAMAPVLSMWDDHEVINDFGASWTTWRRGTEDRPGYPDLVGAGRQAYLAYWPITPGPRDPNRLYRSFHWGQDVDVIMLDVRSYRSRNDEPDTPERAKTMLGAEQLAWVKRELAASRATWKLVTTGVPLSAPTGGVAAAVYGRDGWAAGSSPDSLPRTGFERELVDLVSFLDDQRIENVVFLAADIHLPLAVAFAPDPNGDGRPIRFHELVAGPFSAAPRAEAPPLSPALRPTLLYREGGLFNFGQVVVARGADGVPRLTFSIHDVDGAVRPASVLQLDPI